MWATWLTPSGGPCDQGWSASRDLEGWAFADHSALQQGSVGGERVAAVPVETRVLTGGGDGSALIWVASLAVPNWQQPPQRRQYRLILGQAVHCLAQLIRRGVRVDLGRAEMAMTQNDLYHGQTGATGQPGSEEVAEGMR